MLADDDIVVVVVEGRENYDKKNGIVYRSEKIIILKRSLDCNFI